MTPLSLKLPRGAEIAFNSLYDSKQPILLIQDVALVSMPNDIYIDVGWYPEHDPRAPTASARIGPNGGIG